MPSTTSPRSSYEDLYGRIVGTLVNARLQQNLSQTVLAERLARPRSFVSKYEHRERILDVAEFVEVALAIGVDPVSLLQNVIGERSATPRR